MKTPLRVLVVEDSEFDARILITTLRKGGYDPSFERVQTAAEMAAALKEKSWDIILSDYNMPEFDAMRALKLLQESSIDIPFIIISGGIGEDTAVAAMKAGAHDYLMKGSLARLVPAVERELREAKERASKRLAQQSVRESEMRYRLLWETATDAVLLMDTKSVIHFANPAVEKVFGYKPDEVVGQILTLLLPERIHSDHTKSFSRLLASGIHDSRRHVMETVGRRKESTEVLIEIAFNDMEFQGQRWFVAFIRDITERKRAELELMEHQEQFRIAREIQQRLFPKSSPNISGFDIAGISHPADAAGGDYFDYLQLLDGGIGVVVADVTGHGVGPALLMAETRAYLRVVSLNRHDVGEVLTRANMVLSEDVDGERYVTLLMLRIDPGQRRLTYANAGHPAACIVSRSGEIRARLKRTAVPLGLKPGIHYETSPVIELHEGDTILLLTDGIEEAVSPVGELFGVERAVQVARDCAGKSSVQIADALYQAVRQFSGNQPQEDDITAIVIQVR